MTCQCCLTGEEGGSTNYVQEVEQLADAHRAYAQLFEICEMQGDQHKLHDCMQRHRVIHGTHFDLEQSAVSYVFDRCTALDTSACILCFSCLQHATLLKATAPNDWCGSHRSCLLFLRLEDLD